MANLPVLIFALCALVLLAVQAFRNGWFKRFQQQPERRLTKDELYERKHRFQMTEFDKLREQKNQQSTSPSSKPVKKPTVKSPAANKRPGASGDYHDHIGER